MPDTWEQEREKELRAVIICESCGLNLFDAKKDAGEDFSKWYHGVQYCKKCHPHWGAGSHKSSVHHTRKLYRQVVSYGRIAGIKDRVISREDGNTVIYKSSGKPVKWVGR